MHTYICACMHTQTHTQTDTQNTLVIVASVTVFISTDECKQILGLLVTVIKRKESPCYMVVSLTLTFTTASEWYFHHFSDNI